MLKKTVVVAMMMASSLFALPASASTPDDPPPPPPPIDIDRTGSPPAIPEGGLNCAFISTDHTGNGYWECSIYMIIVSPE